MTDKKEEPSLQLYTFQDDHFIQAPKQTLQGDKLFLLQEVFDSLQFSSSSPFVHFITAGAENHGLSVKIVYYGSSTGIVMAQNKFIGVLHPHYFKQLINDTKWKPQFIPNAKSQRVSYLLLFPVGFLFNCLSELVLHPECPALESHQNATFEKLITMARLVRVQFDPLRFAFTRANRIYLEHILRDKLMQSEFSSENALQIFIKYWCLQNNANVNKALQFMRELVNPGTSEAPPASLSHRIKNQYALKFGHFDKKKDAKKKDDAKIENKRKVTFHAAESIVYIKAIDVDEEFIQEMQEIDSRMEVLGEQLDKIEKELQVMKCT